MAIISMNNFDKDGVYVVIDNIAYKAVSEGNDIFNACLGCDFFVDGTCDCRCQDAISICHCLRKIYRRVYGVFIPKGNKLPEKFDYAYAKEPIDFECIGESVESNVYLKNKINK